MSSPIFKDLAAIRERQEVEDRLIDEMFARQQERFERERTWRPAEIIWQSEWYQGFGEEAQEFIGRDEGKYYCAFTRSPAQDEEYLSWDGPYETRGQAEQALNERLEHWREELEAEQWAHARMRDAGIPVPRQMTRRAKAYVHRKMRQAFMRGATSFDSRAVRFTGSRQIGTVKS